MRLLYTVLYAAVLLLILPYQLLKRPSPRRSRWLRERLGMVPDDPSRLQSGRRRPVIWIHAVSVGEVIASTPLIRRIKDGFPRADVVVSTVTDTGQQVALERVGGLTRIVYVPFDLPFAVRNALKHVSPSLFIVMETELWPNLLQGVRSSGVPVVLMNGRISDRSFRRYKKAGPFIRKVLSFIDSFCMQNSGYAERIVRLGASPGRVETIGNLKFDTRPPGPIPAWASFPGGITIVAGSTHKPEEDLIIRAYQELKRRLSGQLRLVIAPRHPERFGEVEEILRRRGIRYARRSEAGAHPALTDDDGQVILLDVMGELSSVYGACDIAVMGGSFNNHGGQNLLEPAFWAKAIVCGPHMDNFPVAEEFFRKGGALRADQSTLVETLMKLIESPDTRVSMGSIARRLYDANTGATERAMKVLTPYLERAA